VRINGIVHLKSRLPAGQTVPIGRIAIGDPAAILPLTEHEKISEMLTSLNFRLTAYGIDRPEAVMKNVTRKMCDLLGTHREDRLLAQSV
jgi:hypothetical protein